LPEDVAVLLALLAATAFAFGTVLQQKGTLETEGEGPADARFLTGLFRQRVWLLGGAAQVTGWVLQAVALHEGSLVVVQSVTTLSLVIALPLGVRLTDQRVNTAAWAGAVAVAVGIIMFLLAGTPGSGAGTPSARDWWAAGLVTALLAAALSRAARNRSASARALCYGSAAGLAFGMQAAVTKVFTDKVGGGLDAILRSWEVYALVVTALVGFALQQSALKAGALAPAMASSNAMTLFASVALGLAVFEESVKTGADRSPWVVVGLALALVGVTVLARATAPPPAKAEPAERVTTGARTP
jgi:uncharacterized membrane protein